MSTDVPFIRVVPEEIECYGFAGATFVAHIRYRCLKDGPGRFVVDGVRWWEVPLADLAGELHVSKDVAQRTMKRLGDAVATRRSKRPGDQTRAYHVPAYSIGLTTQNAESHRSDQPERDSAPATVDRRGIASVPTRNRTGTDAKSRSVPPSGEGKEGGEAGCVPDEPLDVTAGPGLPEQYPEANNDDSAPPTQNWVMGPHGPRCRRHINDPDPPDCPGCGRAREGAKVQAHADREAIAAEKAAIRAAIVACTFCDHNGMTHGDEPRRCTRHRQQSDVGRAS